MNKNKWSIYGEELEILTTKSFLGIPIISLPTRAFLNERTGEVRFFTSFAVEKLGSMEIEEALNKGEL